MLFYTAPISFCLCLLVENTSLYKSLIHPIVDCQITLHHPSQNVIKLRTLPALETLASDLKSAAGCAVYFSPSLSKFPLQHLFHPPPLRTTHGDIDPDKRSAREFREWKVLFHPRRCFHFSYDQWVWLGDVIATIWPEWEGERGEVSC